jgi:hypothetical protein
MDDLPSGSDGLITINSSPPSLKFSPKKVKTCETCGFEVTYEEMKKGIVCRAAVECVDEKQWKKRKYESYSM